MPQIVDLAFVRVINARSYVALQTTRRNAGNTAYEFSTGVWTDQAYSNPSWITALANAKITGLGTLATQNGTFSGTSSGTNTGDQTTSNSDGSITVATGTTNPVVSMAATFQTKSILSGAW